MKKLIFFGLLLLVFGAGSVFAQRGGGRPGGMGGGQRPQGAGQGQRPEGVPQRPTDSYGKRGQGKPEGLPQRPAESYGRGGQRPQGAGNGQLNNRALNNIGLSDEQKSQIKQIRKDAKTNGTDQATVRSQIEGVLTPEQLEKLKDITNKKP